MKFILFFITLILFSNDTIINEHCFDINLEDFGKVKFEPHQVENKLQLFLNKAGKQIYKFPEKEIVWTFESIQAVSFLDINKDKKKDIILVVEYITGIGPNAAVPFPVPIIYLADKNKFYVDPKSDKISFYLEKKKMSVTIPNIKKVYKLIK